MAATPSAPPPVLPVEQAVEYAAETGHVPANAAAAASQVGNLFVGAALAEALGILAFVLGILIWLG